MKAIQITATGKIGTIEIEKPVPESGEVLIKILYAGFCGSDLNTFAGKNPMVKLPVIPGHEIGAEIVETGKDVPTFLKKGLLCTVNPYTACGHCTSCRNGRPNACRFNETFGVQRDGAMLEYKTVPWEKVIIDEENRLSALEFALVEPLSVGFHAVARGQVSDLDTVLVIGCGMIGLGALIRSVIRGARVIAADVDDEKLAMAQNLGALYTINTRTEDVHSRLMEITSGAGPDAVIEAVGVPATYQMAINEVTFTGRVVCIGYAKTDISFETKLFVQKELDIRGSRNAMPEDFRAVMQYMKKGNFPNTLISGIYRPCQAAEAMQRWQAEPEKVFRIMIGFNDERIK
ncbi:MAG: zinc-binding alcohol dehydrogenase family protein [Dysgonamonadaceae bacterium]|jgi:threonine dehydrogenase-like Zn-dependent dehydrogenase|nr:zinc-binding alcohol dehydrogenase family protein [Dysgonamonadaceae bacterium]